MGADARGNPCPLPIAVASNLRLPAIFLWEEKLVVHLIATPNIDKCNRIHARKGQKDYATCYLHNSYAEMNIIPFCIQIGQSPKTNYSMSKRGGSKRDGNDREHLGSCLFCS
jgi:hypothetical protein